MGCPRCKLQTDDLFAEIDRDLSQTQPGPSQTNILTTLWKGGQFRLCFHNNDKANFAPDDEHAFKYELSVYDFISIREILLVKMNESHPWV